MTTYELTYIFTPEMASKDAEEKAHQIESAITGKEGIILKQSIPAAKVLSYPIEKHASGFFGVIEFQLEPEKLVEIKEMIGKDGNIVRHMLVVKHPQRIRKERRGQKEFQAKIIQNTEMEKKPEAVAAEPETPEEKAPKAVQEHKPTVELKDIEHELDEILGE